MYFASGLLDVLLTLFFFIHCYGWIVGADWMFGYGFGSDSHACAVAAPIKVIISAFELVDGWMGNEGRKEKTKSIHTHMQFVNVLCCYCWCSCLSQRAICPFFDLHQSRRLCQPCVRVLLFLFFDIHPSTA